MKIIFAYWTLVTCVRIENRCDNKNLSCVPRMFEYRHTFSSFFALLFRLSLASLRHVVFIMRRNIDSITSKGKNIIFMTERKNNAQSGNIFLVQIFIQESLCILDWVFISVVLINCWNGWTCINMLINLVVTPQAFSPFTFKYFDRNRDE